MTQFFSVFANPGGLLFALLLVALPLSWWRRSRGWGVGLGIIALTGVLLVGALPVRDLLLRPLEDWYPVPTLPEQVDGIVVLGGSENPGIFAARGWPEVNSNADRLIAFVGLARRYPDARLLFSGGSAIPHPNGAVSEADVAAAVFGQLGLDPTRVTYEQTSRNTAENVKNSLALAAPQPGEIWVLITSAQHMPRAMASFTGAGWPVLPYPVDFQTGPPEAFDFNPLGKLATLSYFSREWFGLIGYRIMGYTTEILPSRRSAETKP